MIVDIPKLVKQKNKADKAKKRKAKKIKIKSIRKSRASELWYRRQLVGFVNQLRARTRRATAEFKINDPTTLEQLLFEINKISTFSIDELAYKLARGFAERARAQTDREIAETFKRISGFDIAAYIANNPKIDQIVSVMIENNVQLIKSIETQYLDKVKSAVSNGVSQGKSARQISDGILKVGNVTRNRAIFIARDQAAKFNGTVEMAQQKELGIKKYRWSTSGGERVRDSHREKDGKVFLWSKPPADTGHPGFDYSCRCVAIPIFDDEE